MKILIIRRDNIGDLVCTTPLIRSLRKQLPNARIEVLVTRYNRAVLDNHPDIDALHFYIKAKHRSHNESILGIYGKRLITIAKLRQQHFDIVLVPEGANATALRLARWVKPKHIIIRGTEDQIAGPHEVEQCCHLLTRMGLQYETPAPHLVADSNEVDQIAAALDLTGSGPLIGIHISARKPSQRWGAERFISLMEQIHQQSTSTRFILLWAPGSQDNPLHPGDDEKAHAVLADTKHLPVHPIPTSRLEALIAAISLCDAVICADGGAMHLAAGLGKPIVALFGRSGVARWRPWCVPQVVLQKPSQEVSDISTQEVVDAFHQLMHQQMH
ncbi:MAG: glycosyltransferase family 9 protein [Betaproteobacteria bacterium]|nr:MAG: glycosyltransferase family 9 protein [Betaproteobacteria bacterium]